MPQVLIQPTMETFPQYREYAAKMGFSFEIVDFAAPKVLNSTREYALREQYYQQALADWPGVCTMHGAFIDINIHSPDYKIRHAARSRVRQNLATARKTPGNGTLAWAEIDFYLSRQAEASTVVLEVSSLEAVERSVLY